MWSKTYSYQMMAVEWQDKALATAMVAPKDLSRFRSHWPRTGTKEQRLRLATKSVCLNISTLKKSRNKTITSITWTTRPTFRTNRSTWITLGTIIGYRLISIRARRSLRRGTMLQCSNRWPQLLSLRALPRLHTFTRAHPKTSVSRNSQMNSSNLQQAPLRAFIHKSK